MKAKILFFAAGLATVVAMNSNVADAAEDREVGFNPKPKTIQLVDSSLEKSKEKVDRLLETLSNQTGAKYTYTIQNSYLHKEEISYALVEVVVYKNGRRHHQIVDARPVEDQKSAEHIAHSLTERLQQFVAEEVLRETNKLTSLYPDARKPTMDRNARTAVISKKTVSRSSESRKYQGNPRPHGTR